MPERIPACELHSSLENLKSVQQVGAVGVVGVAEAAAEFGLFDLEPASSLMEGGFTHQQVGLLRPPEVGLHGMDAVVLIEQVAQERLHPRLLLLQPLLVLLQLLEDLLLAGEDFLLGGLKRFQ